MSPTSSNPTRLATTPLQVGDRSYRMYRVNDVPGTERLPVSLRILLENLMRHYDGRTVTDTHVQAVAAWDPQAKPSTDIQFYPGRVIMQDFTGVPCVVDLAAMREAVTALGGDARAVNPGIKAELVIDHSVIVDSFGQRDSMARNMDAEYHRNAERYQFLRWGQSAFANFTVVPPGQGIVHQVNLEHLAQVVLTAVGPEADAAPLAYPDTCVGTDSHTTMINGLGVLGWGVGGIEAEAAMLGHSISMLLPRVVGFKLTGSIPSGATATDVVLTITQRLREVGVVGDFVEFFGEGVTSVPLANRATIGNMSPEFGSTCAIFPVDDVTLDYLRLTGRSDDQVELVRAYTQAQGLWNEPRSDIRYSQVVELDLSTVVPSIAGPKRPQDRISLSNAQANYRQALPGYTEELEAGVNVPGVGELTHGKVVVAAITSCTNTSNPSVMIAAGLLARKAIERGLHVQPWVKTSLAPGSTVVTRYFAQAGLLPYLEKLGFGVVGYGCTTCIGNSGPLPPAISAAINERDLAVAAVLSGNRNFEGRINPDVKLNYLASPPLVVAYALAGTMDHDFATDPLGHDTNGQPVFLADLWPDPHEVEQLMAQAITTQMYTSGYTDVFTGDERWQGLLTPTGDTFTWDSESTYVRRPEYFAEVSAEPAPVRDITSARVLVRVGDSVTTDHISPAGSIKPESPAGSYLAEHGVPQSEFNSYGSRRGNHEVMVRGTFANIRLRNLLLDSVTGGYTHNFVTGQQDFIYDAAQSYAAAGVPLVVLAGAEYGTGSSRDWAAKGTMLLGVRAVLAVSFERIHRSNLVGMGVLPLQFPAGQSAESLGLTGRESFTITGLETLNIGQIPDTAQVIATAVDGQQVRFDATVRIDTSREADYYRHGGIVPYVVRSLVS